MPHDFILAMAQTSAHSERQALMKRVCAHHEGATAAHALLNHADWRVREQAVIVLHRLRVGASAYAIAERLACDEAVNVRVRCAFALAHIPEQGDALVCEALLGALADADGDVRYRACYALSCVASRDDERGFVALLALLDDEVWYVRHAALKALYALDAGRAYAYVVQAQQDPSRRVRQTAQSLLACYTVER